MSEMSAIGELYEILGRKSYRLRWWIIRGDSRVAHIERFVERVPYGPDGQTELQGGTVCGLGVCSKVGPDRRFTDEQNRQQGHTDPCPTCIRCLKAEIRNQVPVWPNPCG